MEPLPGSSKTAFRRARLGQYCPLVWLRTTGELKRKRLSHHIRLRADFVSITVATDGQTVEQTITTLCERARYFLSQPENLPTLAQLERDILAAKIRWIYWRYFNFQGPNAFTAMSGLLSCTTSWGTARSPAYNQRNHVGDGCHERTDGGLSRFGVALIGEMIASGCSWTAPHRLQNLEDAFACANRPCHILPR